jgi:asparagine synthase (glutamine-hydrolysing)
MRDRRPYADCLDTLDIDGQMVDRHPLHQSLYLWNKTMLPNYVLGAERLEMAFGVETRPPFLDHELFEAIRQLPPAWLAGERQGKLALRRVADGVVPDAVRAGGKHPFAAPSRLADARSALHRLVDDMFRGRVLDTMPFFEAPAVRALWRQYSVMPLAQQRTLEPVLLIMFGACVLHERYVA